MTTRRALLDALHAHLSPEHVCAENVTLGGPDGITVDMVAVDRDGNVSEFRIATNQDEYDAPRPDYGRGLPIRWSWVLTIPGVRIGDTFPTGTLIRKGNRIATQVEAWDFAQLPSWDELRNEWTTEKVAAFARAAITTARDRAGWARHLPAYETDWLQRHPHGQVIGRAAIHETAHLRPGQRVPDGWALLGVGGGE